MIPKAIAQFLALVKPSAPRSLLDFAEQEIVLASGPRAGLRFRSIDQPWSAQVLNEMSSGKWTRMFGSGATQSGKTFLFVVVPIMWHLFELGDDVILGAPSLELAQSVYAEKILPSILASRYSKLLPRSGSGSKGGIPEVVRFRHGSTIRMMGAGGSDAQRSSHTAPVICMTEIDKMDEPSTTSRESSPIDQMEARASSFGASGRIRIYGECTVSIQDGRIWQETEIHGSAHRVLTQCPTCNNWSVPAREEFRGWRKCENSVDARELAALACTECGSAWTEAERITALQASMIVARGQTIDKDGNIVGDAPKTNTFGVRWTAWDSMLVRQEDIGEWEWRAMKAESPAALRKIYQFVWSEPVDDIDLESQVIGAIEADIIENKVWTTPMGVVPDGHDIVTIGVDLGADYIWWLACAWTKEGSGAIIGNGFELVPKGELSRCLVRTLLDLRQTIMEKKWPCENGTNSLTADMVCVDSGWEQESVYQFTFDCSDHIIALKGRGAGLTMTQYRTPRVGTPATRIGDGWYMKRQSGGRRFMVVDTNRWKRACVRAICAPAEDPMTIRINGSDKKNLESLVIHLTAEREESEYVPTKGVKRYWKRIRKLNHWLDCLVSCRAAAAVMGVSDVQRLKPQTVLRRRYESADESKRKGWRIGR